MDAPTPRPARTPKEARAGRGARSPSGAGSPKGAGAPKRAGAARQARAPSGGAPREALSLRFVEVAKALARAARAQGLAAPVFRSPPRLVGVSRSIRRQRDRSVTVSVALRNRPWGAVLADMVDGVVAANGLEGVAADRCRTQLWAVLDEAGERAA